MIESSPAARPPALAVVTGVFPIISETFIASELAALRECGLPYRLFALQRGATAVATAPPQYLPPLDRGAPLWKVIGAIIQASTAVVKLGLQRPRRLAAAVRQLARAGKPGLAHHLLQACWLAARLKSEPEYRIVGVHAQWAGAPATVAWLTAIILDIRFSFAGHANDVFCQADQLLRLKLGAACFACVCNPAAAVRLRQLADGAATGAIVTALHGVDLAAFPFRGVQRSLAQPPHLVSVARLVPKKGLDNVLRALDMVRSRGGDFRYTVAGAGSQAASLRQLATRLGLTGRIQWRGAIAPGEVAELLRQADVFVLGCRVLPDGDQDGIANVLLEAMATGVAVVTTDIAGCRALIRHEYNGLLVPPDQPQAMAAAVMRLLSDADLRGMLIRNARISIEQDYDLRQCIAERLRLFRKHYELGA